MKHPRWTFALFALLVADSAFTALIGEEASPLVLWVMGAFELDLATAMALRILYVLPLVWIVDRYYKPRTVFLAYVALYILRSIAVAVFGAL